MLLNKVRSTVINMKITAGLLSHAYNPSTPDPGTGRTHVQGQLALRNKLEDNLRYNKTPSQKNEMINYTFK